MKVCAAGALVIEAKTAASRAAIINGKCGFSDPGQCYVHSRALGATNPGRSARPRSSAMLTSSPLMTRVMGPSAADVVDGAKDDDDALARAWAAAEARSLY